jgi:hypothetical protein
MERARDMIGRAPGHAGSRTKEWGGYNFPNLASRARRGSPDPAVCPTEGLRPHVRLRDLQSARWQGRETLPQRVRRRWESREVICVPFLNNGSKNRPYNANAGPIRNQEMVDGGAAMCPRLPPRDPPEQGDKGLLGGNCDCR